MKKKLALLLAVLMLFCVLPLGARAAGAEADIACRITRVPLSPVQTQVLELLENALRARMDTVDVSEYHIKLDELIDVLNELLWEPEFFYYESSTFHYDYYTEEVTEVELFYLAEYGPSELAAFEEAVQAALSVLLPDMSELQKALVLHDYLTQHIAYDYNSYMAGTVPEDSYNAYGALVKGTAVVKLDGAWYHVDVTWDDPAPDTLGKANHTYFLLSDSAMLSRDSGSGSKHYAWDGDISCTDTTYDGAVVWSEAKQPLIFTDASTVWFMRSEGEGPFMTLKLVKRELNPLLPKQAHARIAWGTGDPYLTSRIMGVMAAALPVLFPKKSRKRELISEPDLMERQLDFDITLSDWFLLGGFIPPIIAALLNIHIWHLIKFIRNLKK